MAVKLSSEAQLVFFTNVFGPSSPTSNRAKAILASGLTFEVTLYALRLKKGETVIGNLTLTVGTTSLMKGTVDPLVAAQNKHQIEEWVAQLYTKHGHEQPEVKPVVTPPVTTPSPVTKLMMLGFTSPPATNKLAIIKAIRWATEVDLSVAKHKAELLLAGTNVELSVLLTEAQTQLLTDVGIQTALVPVVDVPVVSAKPVDAVIDLKTAQALGQKVHGTSSGSIYYTIAFTNHLKVAARIIPGGSISIRAEWTDNPTSDLKKLEESGVEMKSGYASIHFSPQGVPVQRVIGAFLMGTGIAWKQVVNNGADLVIGGQS